MYKPIERAERKFAPTRIPLQLQKELPFASKPKVTAAVKRNAKKATQGYLKARKVLLEPEERKKIALLNKLTAIRNVSVSKVLATKSRKRKEKQIEEQRKEDQLKPFLDRAKKRKYRSEGKEEAKKQRMK